MTLLNKEEEEILAPKHTLDTLETMIIAALNNKAIDEYKARQLHTMSLVEFRHTPGVDAPLEAKLAQHIHLQATALFHNTLKEAHPRDEKLMEQGLAQLVASCYAYLKIMSEKKIKEMMG